VNGTAVKVEFGDTVSP